MAGILSALGSTLNVLEVFSDSDGTAKGVIKALRGKKMRMIRADGSMLKFINKYIVEPVIVIDKSLKNEEHLDKIIGLHVDMFTGFYMQAFEVMTNVEGISANTVIDTLATDNGGLTRALLSGAEMALESRDFASELLYGDLSGINLSNEGPLDGSFKYGKRNNRNINGPRTVFDQERELAKVREEGKLSAHPDLDLTKVKDEYKAREEGKLSAQHEYEMANKYTKKIEDEKQRQKERREGVKDSLRKEKYKHALKNDEMDKKHLLDIERARLTSTKDGNKAGLGRGAKELFIPEAIIRNIELTITTEITQGKNKGREIIMNIPITIKANVLFTDIDNIVNAIQPSGDEFRFGYRWDEYRSGAISLSDFIFATDLIKKYKANRIKDKNSLMEIINARSLSANSKMIDNGFAGFEKYYNMVILNSANLPIVERQLRGKIHNYKYKEKFLEYIQGFSVTIVDNDYERIHIGLKDVRGVTDVTFKTVIKTEKKGGADISEIVKALMANRSPAF